MSEEQEETSELDDAVALFSEYYEGTLPDDERAEVDKRLAEDPAFKDSYNEFVSTMEVLSGMHKMSAPMDFDKKVEGTIHERSGGRFFGRRAFGDRIPFEILAIVVMVLAALVYWMGRSSSTGGHKLDSDDTPAIKDSRDVVPRL